jgi:hypothetical protein
MFELRNALHFESGQCLEDGLVYKLRSATIVKIVENLECPGVTPLRTIAIANTSSP